eukprot:1924531-Amphidinium_carterae.1
MSVSGGDTDDVPTTTKIVNRLDAMLPECSPGTLYPVCACTQDYRELPRMFGCAFGRIFLRPAGPGSRAVPLLEEQGDLSRVVLNLSSLTCWDSLCSPPSKQSFWLLRPDPRKNRWTKADLCWCG